MGKNLNKVLEVNPNLRREGYTDEPDIDAFKEKLGMNFEKSHPEVYKAGKLKKAKLLYNQGKYSDAMTQLEDGFNIESIKKRYDPKFMQRFFAE